MALFEALNWAVALDERTAETWAPHGDVLGWEWRREIEGGEMLRGVRFARNSMHHDWSEALQLGDVGRGYPREFPARYREWVWRAVEGLPARGKADLEGEAVYVAMLAGRTVRSTLVGLHAGFDFLRSLLEPSLVRPVAG